jgi:uncharacterized repeat protein (TIGR03803 family)
LALDANGNLYGATNEGGAFQGGMVFQLTPAGQLNTLHSFSPPKQAACDFLAYYRYSSSSWPPPGAYFVSRGVHRVYAPLRSG